MSLFEATTRGQESIGFKDNLGENRGTTPIWNYFGLYWRDNSCLFKGNTAILKTGDTHDFEGGLICSMRSSGKAIGSHPLEAWIQQIRLKTRKGHI